MKKTAIMLILLLVCTLGISSASAAAAKSLTYAFVEKVVDPYTLEVSIGRKLHTVRLLGLTPLESLKPQTLFKLSDLKADSYVANHVYNTFVYLETDDQEYDFEDRLLAYVWLDKPITRSDAEIRAKMLNAKILLEGYGQWTLTLPNYKYTSNLRTYSEEAQKKSLGIWQKTK